MATRGGRNGDPSDGRRRDHESPLSSANPYRGTHVRRRPSAPETTFADLGLDDRVLKVLRDVGYETPTPIQAATIPTLLEGRDVVGLAQTGTGKTAAFALPILSRLDRSQKAPQALVLAPTRELAVQVCEAFERYAAHIPGVHVLPVYGGQGYGVQLSALRRGVHVVVGTPGRIMDHLDKGTLDLSQLRFLVLDEADEMLNMGFAEDVETILASTPEEKNVALFSATMPTAIRRMSTKYLRDAAGDHGQEQDRDRGQHRPAGADGVLPAEDRRAHAHPRGRELRGRDRLRAHQARDRDAGREAAGPRLQRRRDQRRHRPAAARAHGQPAQGRQARHPRRHRRRGPRPRRRADQPRRQLRHPDRPRVLRAPDRSHRPRRSQRRGDLVRHPARALPAQVDREDHAPAADADAAADRGRRQRHPARALRRRDHRGARRTPSGSPSSATSSATTSASTTCPRPTSPRRWRSSPRARPRCCSSRSPSGPAASAASGPSAGPGRPHPARAPPPGRRPAARDVPDQRRRRHKVEPRQIVGALANEGDLSRRDFGAITIRPEFSLVELPAELPPGTEEALAGTRISGKLIELRRDNGPRRRGPRPARDDDRPPRKARHRNG